MKRSTVIIFLSLMMLLCSRSPAGSYSIHPDAGKTSAAFLKIPPGGRGVSMGEAQTGVFSDAFGMWWNPAGIAVFDKKRVALSHNRWFQNMNVSFISGIFPLSGDRSAGFMLDALTIASDMERRSGADESDPFFPLTESEGEFGAYDMMAAGVYASRIAENIYAGGTLKWILQNIDDEKASAAAVDIGIIVNDIELAGRKVTFGASIRNFGTAIKFNSESYNLPLDINIGGGMTVTDKLAVSMDINKAIDDYIKTRVGFEYDFLNKVYVRSGYTYRMTGNPLGGLSGFRAGMGAKLWDFVVDYSYSPYSYLGESHRISVQYLFGRKKPRMIRNKASMKKMRVKKKPQAVQKYSLRIEPYTVTPSEIIWRVLTTKERGFVSSVEYITSQQDINDADFEIAESTATSSENGITGNNRMVVTVDIVTSLIKDNIRKQVITLRADDAFNIVNIVCPVSGVEIVLSKDKEQYELISNSSKQKIDRFTILIEEKTR